MNRVRSLSDYLDILRRRRWLLISATLLGLLLAGGYVLLVPWQYESTASVLVQATGSDDASLTDNDKGEINLDTEAQVATSTEVSRLAGERLGDSQSPHDLAANASVTVPSDSAVMNISFLGSSPTEAQDGARAFAAAYLAHRSEAARTRLAEQAAASESELTQLQSEREAAGERLDDLGEDDDGHAAAQKEREVLDAEITELSASIGQLNAQSAAVGAGLVINDADRPDAAVAPQPWLVVPAGGGVGLLLGLVLTALRHRFSARLWLADDLPRRSEVRVLAELPRTVDVSDTAVLGAYGQGGRIFNKLRNEVAAAIGTTPAVIVVAGTAPGSASTVVTSNLAAAMARTGDLTVAVAGHTEGHIALVGQLDAPAVPGLTDVLTDRAELGEAVHRAARQPQLHVLGPGASATTAGISPETVRSLYTTLRAGASYVVVDAPSLATSADAQVLAAEADAVLLAVECGRDRFDQIREATEALRRVDAPVLGAVAVPDLDPEPSEPMSVPDTEAGDPPRRMIRPRGRRAKPDNSPTEAIPRVPGDILTTVNDR